MERKIKYITFHTKKRSEAYQSRTCSPYIYPKCSKYTVPVKKVMCKYRKIITKNCKINDILKFMDTDLLFPMNSTDYTNLLIEVTENSNSFFDSFSTMRSNNNVRILRLAFDSIRDNYPIIESLLYNELEKSYSSDIKTQVKILRFNLVICIGILIKSNDIAQDWMAAQVVENLENYVTHLRSICNFIYLIILKKRSIVVNKMLPAIAYKTSDIYICSLCGQPEVNCRCFTNTASTSNRNNDPYGDYFSPVVKNFEDENVPHCSKSASHAEMDDGDIWHQYLANYGYYNETSKYDSHESSTDTD